MPPTLIFGVMSMQQHLFRRRRAVLGIGTAIVGPGLVLAARPQLTFSTGATPPLTAAAGQPGFAESLLRWAFDRIGYDIGVVSMTLERSLINADSGVHDGDLIAGPAREVEYPNLLRVPEKLLDFDIVGYTGRTDVQARDWVELVRHRVGYLTGWKAVEQNLQPAQSAVAARDVDQLVQLLANDRVDVVLGNRWNNITQTARRMGITVRRLEPPLRQIPMFTYLNRRHQALVPPLATALAEAKRSGQWQRLYEQILLPLESGR